MNRAKRKIRIAEEPLCPSTLRRVLLTSRFNSALSCLLMLFGALSMSQVGAAQSLKFTSPVNYPAGSPFVVAAGDFNGDGKMDLVVGDVVNNNLLVLLGRGDGTLRPAVTYHLPADPHHLIAADFNRDGKLDLAIGASFAGYTGILFGKGDGSFESPVKYAVGGYMPLVADFNRDGWPDLVLPAKNGVSVLLGAGNGTLQTPKSYAVPMDSPYVLAAGDFNRDGRMDLVVVSRGSKIQMRIVSVLLGKGDGTFQAPISATGDWGIGSGPYTIAVGDFDRDGKLDVVVTDEYLTVLKGNGDGTFKALSAQPRLSNTMVDLKVADFNGDGKLDLICAGVFRSEALQILLGNGDGTFGDAGWNLIPGVSSVSVVVADFNGDTKPDVAAEIDAQLAVALRNVTPGNVDNTDYFVHQHYLDFLDREPDALGFNFWSDQINSCGADQQCIELKRDNVSAAFYLSIEFQQTAYLVERMYKTAFGDATGTSKIGGAHQLTVPVVRFDELLMDTQQIGQDVIVGQDGWDAVLENNKQNFLSQFVQRPRFTAAFPTMLTPSQFVDALNQNAGNVLSPTERAAAIASFGTATDTSDTLARAQALRLIAENQNLYNAEFNRAFVLTEYFGYLRRNPNEGPDTDYSGYDFWLNKLSSFNGDFQKAEMVKAFISSSEYRKRFGP